LRSLAEADGLVNTPMGMAKLPGMPVPAALLRAQLWVAEIVYFPLETELLRNARALGCRTLDGGNMAVFQAVKAFELFSGVVPDAQRMLAHFQSMLMKLVACGCCERASGLAARHRHQRFFQACR
jgi:shikimate dehydrogenase